MDMEHGLGDLKAEISGLPFFGKLILFAVGLGLGLLLITAGGLGWSHVKEWRYNAREAKRLQEQQKALAVVEAKTKSADQKDATADQMRLQNNQGADEAALSQAELDKKGKENSDRIQQDFERDQAYINSDLSNCDRCRDICARLERLTATNPNLGQYRCAADACQDQCAAAGAAAADAGGGAAAGSAAQ